MRVAGGVDESTITLMKVVAAALDPCCKSSNGLIECVPACGPVFRIKLGFLHPAQKCAALTPTERAASSIFSWTRGLGELRVGATEDSLD